jgi:hypothetical protein
MPSGSVSPVNQRRMLSDAVIPHYNGAFLPPDSSMEVRAPRKVLVQELEQRVGLFLLEPFDLSGN